MPLFKPPQILRYAIFASIFVMQCTVASADSIIRNKSAAQYPRIQYDGNNSSQKIFNFFKSTATLKQNGDWTIEGDITHNGLLCADHEIGMRFGVGSEEGDCNEVTWITIDEYVSTQTLCNNSTVSYRGAVHDDYLAENYDKITCAERVSRCTGNCK